MTRLLPGQRLWPVTPGTGYGPAVTVLDVDDRDATIRDHAGRLVTVSAESTNGDHVADWTERDGWRHFHTDARRAMLSARDAQQRAMLRIGRTIGAADLPTLNRVLVALGESEVVAWTPEGGE